MADFRCTYRLQLGPGLGFDDARGLVPYLARARRLPPLPLALAAGAAGLDARLRRRRPDADLGGPRRRGGVPRALRGRARARARDRPRHRPEPHGDRRDGEPLLARPALACEVLRPRLADRRAPALLRRRRARGRAMEDPEVWEATHAKVVELAGEGLIDGVRIDHPDGLVEPSPLPRAPARGRDRARLGREDPRAGRAAARLAGRRDRRLRVPQRRQRALRRPGSRGAADPLLRGVHRRPEAVRRACAGGEARAGADHVHRRGRGAPGQAARGAARARPGDGARLLPRLPHVRRARQRPRSTPRT